MAFLLEEQCNLVLNSSNKNPNMYWSYIPNELCFYAAETQKCVIGYTLLPSAKAATR